MPSPDAVRRWSALDHLECPRCGATHDAVVRQSVCPACGSPLLARYDLDAVDGDPRRVAGPRRRTCGATTSCCRCGGPSTSSRLGEGMTPLLPAPRLGAELGRAPPAGEGRGAAADRARSRPAARRSASPARRELGATRLAMPTNGNAGAAWAAVRRARRPADAGRDAGRSADDHPRGVRGRRRRPAAGRRADLRRRAGWWRRRSRRATTTGSTSRR